jgi:CMP-2-keto-3-deoxyoctulosonic acid synthetase
MKVLALIPARMSSSRFPREPMAPISDKPTIVPEIFEEAISHMLKDPSIHTVNLMRKFESLEAFEN